MVRLPRNEKQTYRLNSLAQMWPSRLTLAMTLTLNFQGQIYNLLYLSQNGPIATKRKANISIELQGLKCDHQVWTWPWPWPWIFKVKYRICYISAKMVRLPRNEKQTYRLNSKASNVTIRFEHGHDLDIEFSRSNIEFAISQEKNGPIATKRQANTPIELRASNVTNGFDLDHNLDL